MPMVAQGWKPSITNPLDQGTAMNESHDDPKRNQPYVPPVKKEEGHPATIDKREEAMKSPEFREALKADEARENQVLDHKDRDLWGRTGAGSEVEKTDPQTSQEREAAKAQRADGY